MYISEAICFSLNSSLVAQWVKHLSPMRETWVPSLDWEDPWRKKWQPTPVLLPGESPWTEKPGGLQSKGLQRVRYDWATKHTAHLILKLLQAWSNLFHWWDFLICLSRKSTSNQWRLGLFQSPHPVPLPLVYSSSHNQGNAFVPQHVLTTAWAIEPEKCRLNY